MNSKTETRGREHRVGSPSFLMKCYLFLYNSTMFALFFKVHFTLSSNEYQGTVNDQLVRNIGHLVKILTYTQLLESVHPILGLVPGGPMMPFLQIIGRLLVNYLLTKQEIRLNSTPYANYLFIVWSSIEIFRYSYYSLRVLNINLYPLTWCRYSLFMPLYPMGGFCESMVILSTIEYFKKKGIRGLSLPNALNISFDLSTILYLYIYGLLIPSIAVLMRYMWTQRRKQLTKTKVE